MSRLSKILFLFSALLVMSGLAAVQAQDAPGHAVAFDGIGFHFSDTLAQNTNIMHYPGDPAEDAVPGFSDAPYLEFVLYTDPFSVQGFFDTGGVRVYKTADLAAYPFMQTIVDELNAMVTDKPDLASYMEPDPETAALPFLPILTHGQVIRARAEYVETESVRGIAYLTVYQAAMEPFLANSFLYTFQGLSTDGQHYVSVVIPLTVDLFPVEPAADFDMAAFQENVVTYYSESIAALNEAPAESVAPVLPAVHNLAQSLSFGG